VLLSKIDGSLVSPFITQGRMRFGTKMGITDVSDYLDEKYFPNCGFDYSTFCEQWISKNCTPLFEFTSPAHQIILEYPIDTLSLIGIRNMSTGNYIPYSLAVLSAKEAGIPITPVFSKLQYGIDYTNTQELFNSVKTQDGVEGVVIVFDNGEMYKLKSEWYIQRSKRGLTVSLFEKDLYILILDQKIDDVSDFLGERRQKYLEDCGLQLFTTLRGKAQMIDQEVAQARSKNLSKKEFVSHMKTLANSPSSDPFVKAHWQIYFKVFDGGDSLTEIIKYLKSQCATQQKLNQVRDNLCGGLKINL